MNTLRKIASILLLVVVCTSCDVEELVEKITGETCEVLIIKLYDEYDEYINEVINNDNLSQEEKDKLIAEYEDLRDEKVQEVQDTCEDELDIF
ncbi:hypothetical protein BN863_12810 [Formosa agariphila KMM 3901]|uniref:Uncharacterized protein n=1 Tax=Formosa agariphila (strain DSM 15362 / KCTC 12365 / LMG 23005 / KMM 3901 / M-2Alg 35-1) TaxID=1347342 RepID=T2KKM4_FORAG|nr:hypothetical protein [Formosa agariphila]CDF78993.1 hypothetical protein BN863_12810 [Formosa agariphila KMM 3901]